MTATAAGKRVFVHVGVPKSGTSFLQAGLRENKQRLRRQGLLVPGKYAAEVYHATLEIRGNERQWGFEPGQFDGTWARLCARARAFDGTSVLSHELLSSARPEQIERAMAELDGLEVHLLVTTRDMARQLPAAWQQGIKHGGQITYREFTERMLDPQRRHPKAQEFWQRQDIVDVLARWGKGLPAERVHVITGPPSGAPANELWDRFLSVLGVDPATVEMPRSGSNVSLGITEIEVLRRINAEISRGEHPRLYSRMVNGYLVEALRDHRSPRAVTPAWAVPQMQELGRHWGEEIRAAGYHVVGDLAELVPPDPSADAPDVDPDTIPAEEARDAAVQVLGRTLRDLDDCRVSLKKSRAQSGRKDQQGGPDRLLRRSLPRRVAGRVKRGLSYRPRHGERD